MKSLIFIKYDFFRPFVFSNIYRINFSQYVSAINQTYGMCCANCEKSQTDINLDLWKKGGGLNFPKSVRLHELTFPVIAKLSTYALAITRNVIVLMKNKGEWSVIYLALANRRRQAFMQENVGQIARSNHSAMMTVALASEDPQCRKSWMQPLRNAVRSAEKREDKGADLSLILIDVQRTDYSWLLLCQRANGNAWTTQML